MTKVRPRRGQRRAPVSRFRPDCWLRPSRRVIRPVVGTPERLGRAISVLTGLPLDEAHSAGRQAVTAEAGLRARLASRRQGASRGLLKASAQSLDPTLFWELEEQASSYLVAVPFTAEVVGLLDELSQGTQRTWYVEKTPLVEPMLRALAERSRGRVELLSPGKLIRHHLSTRDAMGRRQTFVTFPDHHWTGEETSRRVCFFGEDHWFPMLESLLLIRGVRPMLTLTAGDAERADGLIWAEYRPRATAWPVTEEVAREPLAWLARHLEATMRARPGSVFSWGLVAARSARAQTTEQLLERNLVAGFLRAWRTLDSGLDERLIADLLEQLERLSPGELAPPAEVHP